MAEIQQILDAERSQGDVPDTACSIGATDKGEIVYVLHKEGESPEDARKRVKADHPDIKRWADFEPKNPTVKEKERGKDENESILGEMDDLHRPDSTGVIDSVPPDGEAEVIDPPEKNSKEDTSLTKEEEEEKKKKKKNPFDTRESDKQSSVLMDNYYAGDRSSSITKGIINVSKKDEEGIGT